jgi:hypothetical protein
MDYIDLKSVPFNISQAVVQTGKATGYEGRIDVTGSSNQFDHPERTLYHRAPIVLV